MARTLPSACRALALVGAMLVFPGTAAAVDPMGQRLDALVAIDDEAVGRLSTRERADVMASAFDRLFGAITAEQLVDLGTGDLRVYFDAADLALFNTLRDPDLDRMALAFATLVERRQATRANAESMYQAYVSMRAFRRAGETARVHGLDIPGGMPTYRSHVPDGYRGATLLMVPDSGMQLTRVPFTPATDRHIVVVSHPLCRYSQLAIAAIESDAGLRDVFRGGSYWVAPVDRRLELQALQAWNASHPRSRLAIAHRRDEWPGIDHWATPTFYFFANGQLVDKVAGWPQEGRKDDLMAAAEKAGIGDRTARQPQ